VDIELLEGIEVNFAASSRLAGNRSRSRGIEREARVQDHRRQAAALTPAVRQLGREARRRQVAAAVQIEVRVPMVPSGPAVTVGDV